MAETNAKDQKVFSIEDKVDKPHGAIADKVEKIHVGKPEEITDKVCNTDGAVGFEEALEITGFGRYNYTVLVICTVVVLAMALETFGTSYVVAAAVCDLDLTTETKGIISAMPMLGIVVSSHLWGWLADTRGRRTVLLLSMAGSFLCGFAASWSTHWAMLAAFKFVAAFFASASNAVTYALLGESTPRARRDRLGMIMSSGLMCAQAVMTLNAYPLLQLDLHYQLTETIRYKPWRLLQQVFSGWALVSVVLLLLCAKESPKFYASQGREQDSLRVLADIFAINTGRKKEEYPVKSLSFQDELSSSKQTNILRSMWDQTAPLFQRPLLWKTLVITYIVIIVYATCPAFLMWTPTIMNAFSRAAATGARDASFCQLLHLQDAAAAAAYNGTLLPPPACVDKVEDLSYIALLSFSLATAAVNLCNSFVIKFVGKRAIAVLLHAVSAANAFLLPTVYSTTASLIMFFFFQANIIAMGLTTAFTVEVFPTYLRAMAICLTIMIGRGSSSLSISYVGVLLERHCEATFYGFGVLLTSGAVVSLLLPSEQKRDEDKTSKNDVL